MPLYRDTNTQIITNYPVEIYEHPILGASLVPWDALDCDFEEDKVVVEDPLSTNRVQYVAVPTPPLDSTATPKEED
ncbi:hypothetical protein [Frigoribacterium sp. UYMn621]|uniref:hypothetical protein n=1 Tax=Frigoribacterium sp. UYMn621 TaxID=3156343 RepID=UPI00339243F4